MTKKKDWNDGFTAGVLSALTAIQGFREDTIFDEVLHSCVPFDEAIASAKRDGNYDEASGLPQAVEREAGRQRWRKELVRRQRASIEATS